MVDYLETHTDVKITHYGTGTTGSYQPVFMEYDKNLEIHLSDEIKVIVSRHALDRIYKVGIDCGDGYEYNYSSYMRNYKLSTKEHNFLKKEVQKYLNVRMKNYKLSQINKNAENDLKKKIEFKRKTETLIV